MSRRAPWSALLIALAMFGPAGYAGQAPAVGQAPSAGQAPAARQVPPAGQAPAAGQAQAGYSAPALYNLANAYARSGKPGLAVLNYERARLIEPNDPDIEANLRHVREASGLPPESPGRLERLTGLASPRIFAWLGMLGFIVAGVSALARRLYPRHRRKLLAATLAGISLLGVTIASALTLWPIMHEAVVITKAAPVRVSPVPIEEPVFVLPEASIVGMSAEHDGFVLIRTKAGRTGWALRSNLAPIIPKH
jgi:hypothetical protein